MKDIELSISTTPDTFGPPAANASLTKTKSPQPIQCPETTGRYIRMRALSEQNGGDLASMAEWGIVGD